MSRKSHSQVGRKENQRKFKKRKEKDLKNLKKGFKYIETKKISFNSERFMIRWKNWVGKKRTYLH